MIFLVQQKSNIVGFTLEGQRMKFGAKTIERFDASIFVTETTSWAVNICRNLTRLLSTAQESRTIYKFPQLKDCCKHVLLLELSVLHRTYLFYCDFHLMR